MNVNSKLYASCTVMCLHVDKWCLLSAVRQSQSVATFIIPAVTCTRLEEGEVLFE